LRRPSRKKSLIFFRPTTQPPTACNLTIGAAGASP
jgi:hypothetical protein